MLRRMSRTDRRTWTAAVPVVGAVTVFGVSYGVLAGAAGMPAWLAVLMSALVFAGSSQFAAVSILAAGGAPAAAVVSGALLNSRYLATGAVASRVLGGPRWQRFLLAQLVVDESFALAVGAGTPQHPDRRMLVGSGTALWLGWVGGSAVGAVVGPVVGDPTTLGLDAAFPALFIGLLWPLLSSRRGRISAAAGLLAALVLLPLTSPGLALAGAAVAGLAASGRDDEPARSVVPPGDDDGPRRRLRQPKGTSERGEGEVA
jgi:4-azaleucine resistance transporter AzlC